MGFCRSDAIRQERFDWGVIGWRQGPADGAQHLVVLDVVIAPGSGHAPHRHPGQEETVLVVRGTILQYLERESTTLRPGDSVLVPAGVVHASYNDGDEDAHLTVILAPSTGEGTGYGLEDVSDREPWASLRA